MQEVVSQATLYYDDRCVVCRSFVRLLQRKIDHSLRFLPLPSGTDTPQEFVYRNRNGRASEGKNAIDELSREYPEVKQFFWMLPPAFRLPMVQQSYRWAKWIRRFFRGDCDCD